MADFAARRTMMVDTQIRPSDITKFPIIEAMLTVPRENFVPDAMREAAYASENLELSYGRVILEPRTLGKMLEEVDIEPHEVVLDVGCGLGYSSAIIAHLADAVVAVESDPDLADQAQRLLTEHGADNVAVITGTLAEGAAKHGPYDVITIQGAVDVIPGALTDQLKEDGRIVAVFSEGALGICKIGYKLNGVVAWRFSFNANAPVLPGFEREIEFSL